MTNGFAEQLLDWFDEHGRHDLPWQQQVTPYRVWISEIMLQQTRVETVIPYFQAFMAAFPDIRHLAAADEDKVLHQWTGLGYYARARNLHRSARILLDEHQGELPDDPEQLISLPGIGRSTAGAILSLGMGRRAAILDGNVKRVLARCFSIEGWPGRSAVARALWAQSEALTPQQRCADYNQAMMDLGATLCTRSRPDCPRCPLRDRCLARQQGRVDELPGRKPARRLPQRQTHMLVCLNESGEALLEKRPPSGIWGGLWSFPEFSDRSALLEHCQRLFNQESDEALRLRALPPVQHSFTHFHLEIQPQLLQIPSPPTVMEAGNRLWYPLDHSLALGLAAPVRRLLNTLPGATGKNRENSTP